MQGGQKGILCWFLPFVPPDPLSTPFHASHCSWTQLCLDSIKNPFCLPVSGLVQGNWAAEQAGDLAGGGAAEV